MKTNQIILTVSILFFVNLPVVYGSSMVTDGNETSLFSKSDSLFGKSRQPMELSDENLGGSLYKMIISLAVVVVLAIGVMALSKKILPKVAGISGKRLKVVETISLGSRRAVHLVEIGGKQILIGSTQNTITRLAELPIEVSSQAVSNSTTEQDKEA